MPIRVVVVDDSVLFRTKMQFSLAEDPQIRVVGSAANAKEAMAKIEELNPDVVTLDVEMPDCSGIEFLKELIPRHPVPVVVVSSLDLNLLDALSAGAVEYVHKPTTGVPDAVDLFFKTLRAKIKIACHAHVHRPAAASSVSGGAGAHSLVSRLSASTSFSAAGGRLIAIGASTGGTEAILAVVRDLPANMPGIVVVQHMPANFTRLYSERLDKICKMRVKEAADLDRVEPGVILIAAGEYHMTLKKDAGGYYVRSQRGEKVSGHCPSVDVLFDSVAATAGPNAVGVILTGMGADGAHGLLRLHQTGAYTIGQDENSCVVYGMPMEAYKLGAVSRQLPLDEIGDELIFQASRKKTV